MLVFADHVGLYVTSTIEYLRSNEVLCSGSGLRSTSLMLL